MIWSLQKRIEAEMKPDTATAAIDSQVWKKYEKHRARYLERESLRLLGTTLKTDEVYSNLSYSFTADGEQKKAELDGLIAFDRTLLLVEAKAGALTAPARRGGRERIKSNIKALLGKAHQQALCALNYIENTETPKFLTKEESEVPFEKERFARVFLARIIHEKSPTVIRSLL
jgi:hypothetical protein